MWDSSPVGFSGHNAYTGNDRHLAEDCASEFPAHFLPGAGIDVLLLPLETTDRGNAVKAQSCYSVGDCVHGMWNECAGMEVRGLEFGWIKKKKIQRKIQLPKMLSRQLLVWFLQDTALQRAGLELLPWISVGMNEGGETDTKTAGFERLCALSHNTAH